MHNQPPNFVEQVQAYLDAPGKRNRIVRFDVLDHGQRINVGTIKVSQKDDGHEDVYVFQPIHLDASVHDTNLLKLKWRLNGRQQTLHIQPREYVVESNGKMADRLWSRAHRGEVLTMETSPSFLEGASFEAGVIMIPLQDFRGSAADQTRLSPREVREHLEPPPFTARCIADSSTKQALLLVNIGFHTVAVPFGRHLSDPALPPESVADTLMSKTTAAWREALGEQARLQASTRERPPGP